MSTLRPPTLSRRRRAGVVATSAAVAAGVLLAVTTTPAAAADGAADAAATFRTATYGCTGVTQTFGVPTNVTSLSVTVQGAAGGGTRGGGGQKISARVAVTPGQQLLVKVGCRPRADHEDEGGFGFSDAARVATRLSPASSASAAEVRRRSVRATTS